MTGRNIILAFCLICFVCSSAQQQPRPKPASNRSGAPQPVPPPPKPADNGPGLEVTMKFIQDKMNGIGELKYSVSVQDTNGRTSIQLWAYKVTNVVADPQSCTISYHAVLQDRDKPGNDLGGFAVVNLKEARKITVQSVEQSLNDEPPNIGRCTVHPQIFQVVVHTSHKSNEGGAALSVDDEELANRLGRAISHAVELCTPDKKPEPF